jgi:hypothetical protein
MRLDGRAFSAPSLESQKLHGLGIDLVESSKLVQYGEQAGCNSVEKRLLQLALQDTLFTSSRS